MKKLLFFALSFSFVLFSCTHKEQTKAQITYDVRFPNAAHHEAEITLSLENLKPAPVHVTMSRSSPGRYALHEFAKNVYNVHAVNADGDTLEMDHPDLHNWTIKQRKGTVKITYTLYADHAGGTYSGINREHAHLNMPATFMWAKNLNDRPITVRFHPPEGSKWKIATQLKPGDDSTTFTAPNFQYFMDSPAELSNFSMNTWTVKGDTTDYTMRLALHQNGTQKEFDDYTEMAKKVVAEQIAVYGEPAPYDYGTYTFIADYLPYVYGDGMEHRNSTVITSSRSLKDGALQNLGTLSHEFFHSWNVERFRPKGLEPFDFTKANITSALWFAEGFTSYYADLIIRRTGLTDDEEYARGLTGRLNYVLNSPGRRFYNPIEMGRQAPFVDAATSIDRQNKVNTYISYYSWGSVLGLGLDLTLRSKFDNVTLDDYMRTMWQKYGKTEKPYSVADLQTTLAEVTDSPEFAKDFFNRYIYGKELVDLKPLLAKAGFSLEKEHPGKAVLTFRGTHINFEKDGPTVAGNTIIGSPLYKAGLDNDDTLLALDGKQIDNARTLQRLLAAHSPGDSLSITYRSLGKTREGTVVLAEDPVLQLIPFEKQDKKVTSEMKSFREGWLGSKAAS